MYKILRGHYSPDTAYIVENYPYGSLRCKARWWLETSIKGAKKDQTRLMFQTSNPKSPGLAWNKPKGSTYRNFMVMCLNEKKQVQQLSLSKLPFPEHIAEFKHKVYHQLDGYEQGKIHQLECEARYFSPNSWKEWDEKYPLICTVLRDFECMVADKFLKGLDDPYVDKNFYKGQQFRCSIVEDTGNLVSLELDYGDGLSNCSKEWILLQRTVIVMSVMSLRK